MVKASINKGEVKKRVIDLRSQGKTNQEIYNEMVESYFDKKTLILLITGTAKPEDIFKYKKLNICLILILFIPVIFVLVKFVMLGFPKLVEWAPLVIGMPVINSCLAYYISKYDASVYRSCAAFAVLSLAITLRNVPDADTEMVLVFSSAIIIGLSLYLLPKIFPDYKRNPDIKLWDTKENPVS